MAMASIVRSQTQQSRAIMRLVAIPQRSLPSFKPLSFRAIYGAEVQWHMLRRSFSSSSILHKSKKRESTKQAGAEAKGSQANAALEESLDLTQLDHGIATAVSRLKDELSKLRMGGRLSPETIENLRVRLDKETKETVKLGELAQIVPKGGRMVTILVSEDSHMKPINSAILSSNLSLTPQQDPHNALQLNIPIPPPTKESRDQTVLAAKAATERATQSVRESRSVLHKRLQEVIKKRLAQPDEARKSHAKMEKLAEKGQREIKDLFDAAKKAMERA
ncbi:ribosome recycling factor-domain-containing protein [Aspergillus filifer]